MMRKRWPRSTLPSWACRPCRLSTSSTPKSAGILHVPVPAFPADERPADERPADERPADERPADERQY